MNAAVPALHVVHDEVASGGGHLEEPDVPTALVRPQQGEDGGTHVVGDHVAAATSRPERPPPLSVPLGGEIADVLG